MTKRIISLIITMVILVTITTITAYAGENYNKTEKQFLFEDVISDVYPAYYYDEVYYHHVDENDQNSDIDWAIVYCSTGQGAPSGIAVVVADRVVLANSRDLYYTVGWAIYDADLHEIISIDAVDPANYDDFEKGLEEAKIGNPLGDANLDGTLSVLDATYIQRAMARLCEFSQEDVISGLSSIYYGRPLDYISDIDGDGERSVFDATAIQMKLAKVEDTAIE
ncbi:MAG: hypothetical protein IJE16_07190 [Ruminococcus sp.]|nr:hypothetical protein [Ruminococcus sp.]